VSPALSYLRTAMDKKLHLREPRLALLACQKLSSQGDAAAAEGVAVTVLSKRTSDPGYEDLATWLSYHRQAAECAEGLGQPRVITHTRLARLVGKVKRNPYLPVPRS
jgi:hypothetical protein